MSLTITSEASIKRQLETQRGSRIMRPDLGSRLHLLTDRMEGDGLRQDAVHFAREAITADSRIRITGVTTDTKGNVTVTYTTVDGQSGIVEQ